jgi:hypothetical protein
MNNPIQISKVFQWGDQVDVIIQTKDEPKKIATTEKIKVTKKATHRKPKGRVSPYRRYTDEDLHTFFDYKLNYGLNTAEASKLSGVVENTCYRWFKEYRQEQDVYLRNNDEEIASYSFKFTYFDWFQQVYCYHMKHIK